MNALFLRNSWVKLQKWSERLEVRIVGSVVTGAILWFVVPWEKVLIAILHLNLVLVGLALLLIVAAAGAETISWGIWLKPHSSKNVWARLASLYVRGLFLNQIIPTGLASDVWRWSHLSKSYDKKTVFNSLFYSRILMFAGLIAWCGVLFFWLPNSFFHLVLWSDLGILLLLTVAGFIGYRYRVFLGQLKFVHKIFNVDLSTRRGHWIQSGIWALLSWGLTLAAINLFAFATGMHVSFAITTLGVIISLILSWIPWTPSGIGWRDGAFVAIMLHSGATIGSAVILSLFVDFGILPLVLVGGSIFAYRHFIRKEVLVDGVISS